MGKVYHNIYEYQSGVYNILKNKFKFVLLGLLSALFLILGSGLADADPSAGKVQINNTGTEYTSIQDAVDAATAGDTINIGAGTFNEDVDVDKNLTFLGEGENQTVIDSSSDGGYGFADNDTGVDVVIKHLTLQNSQHYGIKFSGGTAVIEDVTVKNSARTEFDFNGMSLVDLKDIQALGQSSSGNGVSFTNSDNITLENVKTRDNAWGGVALYPDGPYYTPGIDSVSITGLNTNEANPLYVQTGGTPVTNLSAPQFKYTVTNDEFRPDGSEFTFYQRNLSQATSYALAIQGAPFISNIDSVITRISDDVKFVPVGLKIANAIEDASPGGKVRVLDGSHEVDDAQIVIDKDITLIGSSKENTKILSQFDTASSGNARGWFLVEPGAYFDLRKVTLDGNGHKVWQAVRNTGSGYVNSVFFKNITYQASGSPYGGTGYAAFGDGPVDIRNSMFENIGRIGGHYFGSSVSGSSFSNNTYTGKGAGDHLDYALDIGNGADINVKNNTVSNNLGIASYDGSTSAGFLVSTYFGPGTGADFRNNTIEGNSTGIYVGYDGSDTSSVIARNNTIKDNDRGMVSTAPLVDARQNFWGHNSGPFDDNDSDGSIPADNPSGLGNRVNGPIWYDNWNTIAITVPTLVSPANNSVINATSPVANDWEDVAEADEYTYQSYNVDGSGNCNLSDIRWTENYTASQTNSRAIPDGLTFCWRVKTVTSYGESDWSELWKVTIDNTAPEKVDGMTIKVAGDIVGCGAVINQRAITVDWDDNNDPNFDYYEYQADEDKTAPFDFTTSPVNDSERSGNIRDEDGTYNYRVRAYDAAGNVGEWSEWCSITLDREAPVAGITNPSDGEAVKGSVDVRGSIADDNPDHYYLRIKNNSGPVVYSHTYYGAPQTFTDHSIYSWDTTSVADGTYTVFISARDAADNKDGDASTSGVSVDSVEVIVDNTEPATTWDSSSSVSVSDTTPTLTGNSTDNLSGVDKVELQIEDSSGVVQPWTETGAVPTDGDFDSTDEDFSATPTSALDEGTYTFKARATDKAGNLESTATIQVTVDNTDPATTITNPDDGDVVGGTVSVTGLVTDDHKLSHYNLSLYPGSTDLSDGDTHSGDRINGTVGWGSGTVNDSGTSVAVSRLLDTTLLSDGEYQIRLAARDAAGNRDTSSVGGDPSSVHVISITVDNTAPDFDIDPTSQSADTGDTVTFDAINVVEDNLDTYKWTVEFDAFIVGDDDTDSVDVSNVTDGTYEVTLTVTDKAGNSTAKTAEVTFATPVSPSGGNPPNNLSTTGQGGGGQGGNGGTGGFGGGFATLTNNPDGTGQVLGAQNDGNDGNNQNNNGDNNGNDEGNVQSEGAGISSASTDNKSSFSWWWLLIVTAILALIYAIYRRRRRNAEEWVE